MKFLLICFSWGFFFLVNLKDCPSLGLQLYFSNGLAYKVTAIVHANCIFLIPFTGKIQTWYPSLWRHQFFQCYWLMNSKNLRTSAPHQNGRSLACICFRNKCVMQLPALSGKQAENILRRLGGALSLGWSSVCSRRILGSKPRLPRGLGTSVQQPKEVSFLSNRYEPLLWFSELMPDLFYICLPRVLQFADEFPEVGLEMPQPALLLGSPAFVSKAQQLLVLAKTAPVWPEAALPWLGGNFSGAPHPPPHRQFKEVPLMGFFFFNKTNVGSPPASGFWVFQNLPDRECNPIK